MDIESGGRKCIARYFFLIISIFLVLMSNEAAAQQENSYMQVHQELVYPPGRIIVGDNVLLKVQINNSGDEIAWNTTLLFIENSVLWPVDNHSEEIVISKIYPHSIHEVNFRYTAWVAGNEIVGLSSVRYSNYKGQWIFATLAPVGATVENREEALSLPFLEVPVAKADAPTFFAIFVSGYLCLFYIELSKKRNQGESRWRFWAATSFFDKILFSLFLAILVSIVTLVLCVFWLGTMLYLNAILLKLNISWLLHLGLFTSPTVFSTQLVLIAVIIGEVISIFSVGRLIIYYSDKKAWNLLTTEFKHEILTRIWLYSFLIMLIIYLLSLLFKFL